MGENSFDYECGQSEVAMKNGLGIIKGFGNLLQNNNLLKEIKYQVLSYSVSACD